MKKIALLFVSFTNSCFGITNYMLEKFKTEYPQGYFSSEKITDDSPDAPELTLTDYIIIFAKSEITNPTFDDIKALKSLNITRITGTESKLSAKELKDCQDTIKLLVNSPKFNKQFSPHDDGNYQVSLWQQYQWSQLVEQQQDTPDKVIEIMYFPMQCNIQHPGESIDFGRGKKMTVVEMLRSLREQPFYAPLRGNKQIDKKLTNKELLSERISLHIMPSLQFYLGFIAQNDPLTNSLKDFIMNFLEIEPTKADQDIDTYYHEYLKSLTSSPVDKFVLQESYSVELLNALQQMNHAKTEKDKQTQDLQPKAKHADPTSSFSSEDDLSQSSSTTTPQPDVREQLIQALELALLL